MIGPVSTSILNTLGNPTGSPLPLGPEVENNAANAERGIGLPAQLWKEMTTEWRMRQSALQPGVNLETAFLAGLAVGWHEARNRSGATSRYVLGCLTLVDKLQVSVASATWDHHFPRIWLFSV